jgi:hypothetical protein
MALPHSREPNVHPIGPTQPVSRFRVEATLAGGAGMLKEYLVGTEGYDHKPPYHPNADSIVRSQARLHSQTLSNTSMPHLPPRSFKPTGLQSRYFKSVY